MPDLVVIGAGPAGLTAATVAAQHGMSVMVLDESPSPGGRVSGQLHEGHGKGGWWRGPEVAAEMASAAHAAGVDVRCGHSVWGIWPGFTVSCSPPVAGAVTFEAPRLLLATGAAERALPMPGWTLPGVMTIGAAQVLVNVHRLRPGRRVLVVGIDALAVSISRALILAGVEVVGVVNPPPGLLSGDRAVPAENLLCLSGAARAAGPNMTLRLAGGLVSSRFAAALALRFLPRGLVKVWEVPVYFGLAALELRGREAVREAVLAPVSPDGIVDESEAYTEPVDTVCLAGGLTPLAELAAVAGCQFTSIPDLGGQVPLCGPEQETTVAGIWAAGNITGVESAQVAMEQGCIAGYSIARDAGACPPATAEQEIAAARERLAQYRATTGAMINPRVEAGRTLLAKRWTEYKATSRAEKA